MLWLRPETDAGSVGKQPARDTGVAADDRPCGGLPAPAASRRKPPGQAIGVVPCLRKSWGEAPAGRQGGKAHLPANNGGWLPCRLPATLRSSPPTRSGQLACRSLPIPSKPQNSPNFGLTSKTDASSSSLLPLSATPPAPCSRYEKARKFQADLVRHSTPAVSCATGRWSCRRRRRAGSPRFCGECTWWRPTRRRERRGCSSTR